MVKCKNGTLPPIGIAECREIINLTPKEKYGPLGVDSNGNVYDSQKKIIGWWRTYTKTKIQVKIYDSDDIFELTRKN